MSDTTPLNPVPLTSEDIEVLRQNKGWFEMGYDNNDAMKVLECFTAADMAVTWEYLDDGDHAGCSEFIGMEAVDLPPRSACSHCGAFVVMEREDDPWFHEATGEERCENLDEFATPISSGRRRGTTGPWRRIHPDVWRYLSDPDTDIDPEQIPSLLDTGEHAVFEDQDIADKGFIQNEDEDDEDECTECGESLDDGEGYDGYCGGCADKIENHNQGGHRPLGETDDEGDDATGPDDECPNCNGAGIVWG